MWKISRYGGVAAAGILCLLFSTGEAESALAFGSQSRTCYPYVAFSGGSAGLASGKANAQTVVNDSICGKAGIRLMGKVAAGQPNAGKLVYGAVSWKSGSITLSAQGITGAIVSGATHFVEKVGTAPICGNAGVTCVSKFNT